MIEVDGINIIEKFGCYVVEGGIEDFLSTAPIKQPTEVDWFERDGVEVDLEKIHLNTRNLKIDLVTKSEAGVVSLIEYIKRQQVSTYRHHTGVTRKCLYLGVGRLVVEGGLVEVSISLRELEPDKPTAVAEPIEARKGELDIDGTPLSKYGIYVIDSDKYQPIEIKKGVSIAPINKDGEVYYKPKKAHSKKRSRTLELFTKGENAINNYLAFLSQLLQDGEHTIGGEKCYYKECKVIEFDETKPGDDWLTFRITVENYD